MSCTFWNLRRKKAAAMKNNVVENVVEKVETSQPVVENIVENVENPKPRKKRGNKE